MINKTLVSFDILLLEDEPSEAYLFKTTFKKGHTLTRLHHVMNGCEALDFLQHKPPYKDVPRPDLILSDFNMPHMNGIEFLMAIKANAALKNIPVIILSTSATQSDITKAYEFGAASYITKPTNVTDFIETINKLEDYWLTLVQLPIGKKHESR